MPHYPSTIHSKLPNVGTTIFTVMSRLAAETGAINLSQGFPDFDPDPELVEEVARQMRAGRNQYAPMPGAMPLREAIASMYETSYGRRYDPETEITVTSGATEAIFSAVSALVHAGDEVIVFEPCYDSYVPAITLNSGIPVFIPLRFPKYDVDWAAVRNAITPRTRLLLINTPHNPTGAVLTSDDVRELSAAIEGTNVIVLADEVYQHIVFDGLRHESLARNDVLAARSIVVGSFGKTYHATGWKVGYAVAPAALTAELRKVHQFVTFSTSTPVQHAVATFLAERRGLAGLPGFFQAKRDLFLRLMEGSRFVPLVSRGSYFLLVDYSAISAEEDAPFALRLTREHGVAAIPTSPFLYRERAPRVLRFCFAKRDETLRLAAERLRGI
jgi:methionine aminotransferase